MDGRLRYRAASRSHGRTLALRWWHRHPLSLSYELVNTDVHPEGVVVEKSTRKLGRLFSVKLERAA